MRAFWERDTLILLIITLIVSLFLFSGNTSPIPYTDHKLSQSHSKTTLESLSTTKITKPSKNSKKEEVSKRKDSDSRLEFYILKLPLEFSHQSRHENINGLKKQIPSLNIINGYHGNTEESRKNLTKQASYFKLYLSHKYYDNTGNPVHLGKVGLYTSFFTLFELMQKLPDHKTCAVIFEDDLKFPKNEMKKLDLICKRLLKDKEYLFYRLSQYNGMNMYKISSVAKIMEGIQSTTITDPFDLYTQKRGWLTRVRDIHGITVIKSIQSSIITQQKVDIDSWNTCLNNLSKGQSYEDGCDLKLH
eukprot:snap_masked-scaffold_36-processed-gene-2.47-mRNA-1 protein AED:1.00 eAED:1.00 QI:0/-1/0/0/-1/1/1/0/302